MDGAAVEAAHEASRYLDAYRLLRAAGDPCMLTGARERLLAGRVLYNLGAGRRARWLIARAFRQARRDPHCAYYYSGQLWSLSGALVALRFVERFPLPEDAEAEVRALFLLRRTVLLATFRDFGRAERLADEAAAIWQHPWLWVERSSLHASADCLPQARAAAERALADRPHYRPALQQLAQLLHGGGQRDAAIALLAESAPRIQSPFVHLQLAELCLQAGRLDEAHDAARTALSLCPEPDFEIASSFASLLAELHYRGEDLARAAMYLRFVGRPATRALADRLERGEPARRVELPVPHVRQDHKTCAPATLTALCRYLGHPAEHLDIVEEICFDGTPSAAERRWCEEHGLLARQFSVTWEAACALLDAGIPFALLTIAPGNAHLQAVVGYDARRRSFLVRDPSTPSQLEYDAPELLARQAFAGPRGLAIAPRSSPRAAALAALALPDAELHDDLYAVERALLEHDRPRARAALDELRERAREHVITLAAERALASYDGNQAALLAAHDRLLALHPEAPVPLLGRLACLDGLARPEERRADLWRAARQQGADPLVQQLCARALAADGRTRALAETWLLASARALPGEPSTLSALATLHAADARFADAHACQRLAATLAGADEEQQLAYFHYARVVGEVPEALSYLEARCRTLGARAAGPWLTWMAALDRLDRAAEAEAVLSEALRTRPDDAWLGLAAARRALRQGDLETARRRLDRARPGARRADWLRVAAELERQSDRREAAIDLWRDVLRTEPLALDGHAALVQLLRELGDREAAEAHLHALVENHPHHAGILRLAVELRDDDSADGLEALTCLCALAPADAWAQRELALRLALRDRLPEARAAAGAALALDPRNPASHSVQAAVLRTGGAFTEAHAAYREAIRLDADHGHAIVNLVATCTDLGERRAALDFIAAEMRRQVLFGQGLHAFRHAARGILADEAILDLLEEASHARPDLRAAHEAAVEQLIALERHAEARARVLKAIARFPLVPDLLLLLARVERLGRDDAAEAAALRRCLEAEPHHPEAVRALASNLARSGDAAQAIALLRAAIARAPLDAQHHVALAGLQQGSGLLDDALTTLRCALTRMPEQEHAWELLVDLAIAQGNPQAAVAVGEAVVSARPRAPAARVGLARLYASLPGHADLALAEFDRAITCAPRWLDAHDGKALLLARLGRMDEALRACAPPEFGDGPPFELLGRRAYLLALGGPSVARAVDEMEALVAMNPAYVFGLSMLARWELDLGNVHKARTHAERAFNLTGRGIEAGLLLLEVCLAQRDLARAEGVLADLLPHGPNPNVLAMRIRLALARGEHAAALADFARLCELPQPGGALVLESAQSIIAARRDGDGAVVAAIEQALHGPNRDQEWPGEVWAILHADRWPWPLVLRRVPRLLRGPVAARAAVANLIENLAERQRSAALAVLRWLWGARLREHVRTWSAMGFALVSLDQANTAVRWLRDYLRFPAVRPWMLNNLSVALRRLGRWEQAAAVVRHAIALPADHVTPQVRAWHALDLALAGDAAGARAVIAAIPVKLDGFAALVLAATETLCELRSAAPVSRRVLRRSIEALERDHKSHLRSPLGAALRARIRQVPWHRSPAASVAPAP